MKHARIMPICAALWLLVPAMAPGADYTVAPDGDDDGPGTSAQPFRTVQWAAGVVEPGDTVTVRDGTYTDEDGDTIVVNVNRAGTESDWITFRSENRWGAVIHGQDNTGEYCWNFGGSAAYVLVEGMEITECFWGGFWSNAGARHITMKGNHVHHIGNVETSSEYGICGVFEGREALYHVYDGNVFHDIGRTGPPDQSFNHDHAIYNCGDHAVIVNNLFYDCNAGWGVHMAGYDTVDDVVVSNNFFAFGNVRGQLILWQPCHNIVIQNNIFYMPAVDNAINFLTDDLENIVIRNNLVFGGGLKDDDDLGVPEVHDNIEDQDPLLVDAAGHDFHLLEGSPAIDTGASESAPDHDHDGAARPRGAGFDMGAYEFPVSLPEEDAPEPLEDVSVPDEPAETADGPDLMEPAADAGRDSTDAASDGEGDLSDGNGESGCGCSLVR
jgi:hypothetical protein